MLASDDLKFAAVRAQESYSSGVIGDPIIAGYAFQYRLFDYYLFFCHLM